VSYAQNHEDILIDRIFPGEIGTFVDVGACHPVLHSNTRFFYERGWRGVNLEPSRAAFQRFVDERPEDLNLNLAASDFEGELTFYEVDDHYINGTSTLSAELVPGYLRRGFEVAERRVEVRTLRSLIAAHGIEPPDLLSIDVEGHEAAVIRGTPLDSWRPRLLVVEATLPFTTTPSHHDWEPLLFEQGYLLATFNGMNRFYLREDLRDRLDRLATPVNFFDGFLPHERLVQDERAEELARRVACLHDEKAHQSQVIGNLSQVIEELRLEREKVQIESEQERHAWERQRADWQFRLAAVEAEQVELLLAHAELEQQHASLRSLLGATQRQLRPYWLLDRLGIITLGYGWARKFKRKPVA
jgi:FkbM family methyltransferase